MSNNRKFYVTFVAFGGQLNINLIGKIKKFSCSLGFQRSVLAFMPNIESKVVLKKLSNSRKNVCESF